MVAPVRMKCVISWGSGRRGFHSLATLVFIPFAFRMRPTASQATRVTSVQQVGGNFGQCGPTVHDPHREPHNVRRRFVLGTLGHDDVVVGVGELNRFRITDSKGWELGSRWLNVAQFEGQRLEFLFKPRRANHSQGLGAQQCPRKLPHRWPPGSDTRIISPSRRQVLKDVV